MTFGEVEAAPHQLQLCGHAFYLILLSRIGALWLSQMQAGFGTLIDEYVSGMGMLNGWSEQGLLFSLKYDEVSSVVPE